MPNHSLHLVDLGMEFTLPAYLKKVQAENLVWSELLLLLGIYKCLSFLEENTSHISVTEFTEMDFGGTWPHNAKGKRGKK